MKAWFDYTDLPQADNPMAEMAAEYATEILFRLTGKKYTGIYEVTECFRGCTSYSEDLPVFRPFLVDGGVRNLQVNKNRGCSGEKLYPRSGVIHKIIRIENNGTEIDPSGFYISNRTAFARKDHYEVLSPSDDMCFTFLTGTPVPKPLIFAAKRLASELILWDMDDESCAIPRNVTSISRQGESFAIMEPVDFIKDGRTGIYEVDLILKTYGKNSYAGIAISGRKTGEMRK